MKNRPNGFTLLEMIIVVCLVGVLATIAFNSYSSVIEKQKAKEAEQIIHAIYAAIIRESLEGNAQSPTPVSIDQLRTTFPPSENFNPPTLNSVLVLGNPAYVLYTADIQRKGGLYTLELVISGDDNFRYRGVTCTSPTPNLCAQLGY